MWQIFQYDNSGIDNEDELLETVETLADAFKYDDNDYVVCCKILKVPLKERIVYPQPGSFINNNEDNEQKFENPGEDTVLSTVFLSYNEYESGICWRFAKKIGENEESENEESENEEST